MTSPPIPVLTDLAAFRVAVAELPESARLAHDARGAVVVVEGAGEWWQAVRDAAASGADAVVVTAPGDAPAGHAAIVELVELSIPVVVSRPHLRVDVAADAVDARGSAIVRAVSVDGAAATDELAFVLRDAIGWMRLLTGGPLELRASHPTKRGVTALLEPHPGGTLGEPEVHSRRAPGAFSADPACTLGVGVLADGVTGAQLRIDVLGETLTEVTIDAVRGPARVVTAAAKGRLVSPPRYETAERLALRRAIAAVRSGEPPSDLNDLLHDVTLAAAMQEAPTAYLRQAQGIA